MMIARSATPGTDRFAQADAWGEEEKRTSGNATHAVEHWRPIVYKTPHLQVSRARPEACPEILRA